MTTLDAPALTAPTTSRSLLPAARTTFALLVLSQLAVVAFMLWEPPFDGQIRFDDIAPIHDSYWPMNVLLGGPAYALGAVTSTVLLALLSPGRGRVLTLVGSVLNLVGGLVFALVITAESLPFAWAADPALVQEEQGRALFAAYNDHFDAFLPYILGSMALVALGVLVAVVGAAASRAVRWWVPAVVLAMVVAQFTLPFDHALVPALSLAERAMWVYLGWCGLRAVLGRG
jgi:hypothetical protein